MNLRNFWRKCFKPNVPYAKKCFESPTRQAVVERTTVTYVLRGTKATSSLVLNVKAKTSTYFTIKAYRRPFMDFMSTVRTKMRAVNGLGS